MSGYTLIVRITTDDLTDKELEDFGGLERELSLFRKGSTVEELQDALDFWSSRGFRCWIYRPIDEVVSS